MEHLDTGHETWDQRWQNENERTAWSQPHELVIQLGELMRRRGGVRVLDLGCGIGRHAHYLASSGFQCVGVDASTSGLTFAREQAASDGLNIDYRTGSFYA